MTDKVPPFKVQRHAVLDGDIIAYQTAAWAKARQVDELDMIERLEAQMTEWVQGAFADTYTVALSVNREDNFRRTFMPTYKAHRDGFEDPPGRAVCVAHIMEKHPFIRLPGLEADDVMGIVTSAGITKGGAIPVAVTIDKDLLQVPGWHYNPDKDDFPRRITLEEADHAFYIQWMTGDATDNVPGIFKVGPVKAEKILAASVTGRPNWSATVLEAFHSHPRKYDRDYALAQARAVRILRHGEWDPRTGPKLWEP